MKRLALFALLALASCGNRHPIGRAPELSTPTGSVEHAAMMSQDIPLVPPSAVIPPSAQASLWSQGRQSLLGEQRAGAEGDILTVVIEINDKAEITNSSGRSRSGSEQLGIGAFFGLPQLAGEQLPVGASLDPAVSLSSTSQAQGQGSTRRNEKLTLRVAATVIGVLPNGVLSIKGRQEIRVNYEMRELLVSGYVRPADISRQNEVTYDKIAAARISYGGRGQISEMQQPRFGQQIVDRLLPF